MSRGRTNGGRFHRIHALACVMLALLAVACGGGVGGSGDPLHAWNIQACTDRAAGGTQFSICSNLSQHVATEAAAKDGAAADAIPPGMGCPMMLKLAAGDTADWTPILRRATEADLTFLRQEAKTAADAWEC